MAWVKEVWYHVKRIEIQIENTTDLELIKEFFEENDITVFDSFLDAENNVVVYYVRADIDNIKSEMNRYFEKRKEELKKLARDLYLIERRKEESIFDELGIPTV